MDKLPQELVEYIIDFLHDDPITLNACSLTGHAWCSAARQHTFGTINISTKSHIASLEKSNGPFSYAQTLSIWPKCATMRILNASGWSRLANLTNLSLQCELPSFGIELDDALQLFLDNFPVLETLTIRNSRVRSLGTIMRAIHLLPRLSDLILDQVYWSKGYDTSDPEFPLSTFRLRHIQLLNMQIEPLVSCLLKLHPKLGLWSFTAETQHNTLPHLLQSCRESLRTLDLRQKIEYKEFPNLAYHTELRDIILPGHHEYSPRVTFGTITSTHLVRIHAILLSHQGWETYPWEELDDVMDEGPFQSVKLFVGLDPTHLRKTSRFYERKAETIRNLLPKAIAREVLEDVRIARLSASSASKWGGKITRGTQFANGASEKSRRYLVFWRRTMTKQ